MTQILPGQMDQLKKAAEDIIHNQKHVMIPVSAEMIMLLFTMIEGEAVRAGTNLAYLDTKIEKSLFARGDMQPGTKATPIERCYQCSGSGFAVFAGMGGQESPRAKCNYCGGSGKQWIF